MNALQGRALRVLGCEMQYGVFLSPGEKAGERQGVSPFQPSEETLIGLLETWLDTRLAKWGIHKMGEGHFNVCGSVTINCKSWHINETAETRIEALVLAVEAAKEATDVQA